MTEDELIEMLKERQNNGGTSYVTFGDLVAMVPSDQTDEWRAVLAKSAPLTRRGTLRRMRTEVRRYGSWIAA